MLSTKLERLFAKVAARRAKAKENSVFVHPSTAIRAGPIRRFLRSVIYPYYFTYYRVPTERSSHAHQIQYCRHKGLLMDDNRLSTNALTALAYELTPLHLKQEREKRLTVSNWLLQTRCEWDPAQQNYDPSIPYLAPYIEEARFLLQEEEELLQYHPWHRKLMRSGCTGFGEKDRRSKVLSLL